VAPRGQRTEFTLYPNGLIKTVTNPENQVMSTQ